MIREKIELILILKMMTSNQNFDSSWSRVLCDFLFVFEFEYFFI